MSGLDLAAVNSGYCRIVAASISSPPGLEVEPLAFDAIVPEEKTFLGRLELAKRVSKLVEGSDLVVLEDYARRIGRSNTTAYECGEFVGQVKERVIAQGIPLLIVPPTTMRSYVGAARNSGKFVMEEWAEEVYGFASGLSTMKKRSDVADAFIHCTIGALYYFAKTGKLEREVVDPRQSRIIYGDGKMEGLIDRSGVLVGEIGDHSG